MREAFELWCKKEGLPTHMDSRKAYMNAKTRLAWRSWKAAKES